MRVTIHRGQGALHLIVEDDGVGTDAAVVNERLSNGGEEHSISALKNIQERIRLKYGTTNAVRFSSVEGKGTRVEVVIPLDSQ